MAGISAINKEESLRKQGGLFMGDQSGTNQLRCLVDAAGEGFADSVIEQVLAAVVGREVTVSRMPDGVERLTLVEVRLSLSSHLEVLPGRLL